MTDATLAFADILAAPPAALVYDEPNEPWFIEPRDTRPASEVQRQSSVLAAIQRLGPECIVWAVPNAAKRTRWAAQRARKEGMLAGVPDLTIFWPGGVACIEMKDGTRLPTPEQRRMLNVLHRAGHYCGVFRTARCAIDWLRRCGAPIREARW